MQSSNLLLNDENPTQEADALLGHEKIEQQLLDDYNQQKIPSAYIFAGSRGVGKASMANRFTQFLLTSDDGSIGGEVSLFGDELPEIKPISLDAPKDNDVMRRITAGSCNSLLYITPEYNEKTKRLRSEIVIDQLRKINGFLSLTAVESKFRVIIIDSVDVMNVQAANAMLKWLEEPPANALFILIAHNYNSVMETVRSRCRKIAFLPLSFEVYSQVLTKQLPDLSAEDYRQLYMLSSGSAGTSIDLHNVSALVCYADIIGHIANLCAGKGVAELYKFTEKLAAGKTAEDMTWQQIQLLLQGFAKKLALTARIGKNCDIEFFSKQEQDVITHLAVKKPVDYWLKAWDKMNNIMRDTQILNLDKKLTIIEAINLLAGCDDNL